MRLLVGWISAELYHPLQNRHGVDGPVPVTAPPRRNLETQDKWGGVSFLSPASESIGKMLRLGMLHFTNWQP
jgi:hypothetical protein